MRISKINYKIIIAVLAVILIMIMIFTVFKSPQNGIISSDIDKGLGFIKSNEQQDVIAIENEIYNNSKAGIMATLEKNIEEDPDYVWTALSQINTVYLGDSRIKALKSYGFVDESRCFGVDITTIGWIPDYYEDLKVINPKMVVILYGLNDVGSPWMTADEWCEQLFIYIDEIQSFLPDCKIYVLSNILPRRELDERWYGMYDLTREWNTRELELFAERGYNMINIGDLVEENVEYFMDDGVHMLAPFYPKLAKMILTRYMEDELG